MSVSGKRSVCFLGWLCIVISCQSGNRGANPPVVPDPPAQTEVLLASMARASGVGEGLVLDHALRVAPEPRETILVLASTEHRRFVTIFERDATGECVGRSEQKGYRVVMKTSLDRLDPRWMRPDTPVMADMDGDGRAEIFLGFQILAADRMIQTGLICRRSRDGWETFASPSPLDAVRRALPGSRAISIHQEDKMQTLEVAGKKLRLQGLSKGGGWRLVPGPGGEGAGLLAIGALSGSDRPARGLALVVYRLGDDGLAVASDWNDGRVLFTPVPTRWADLDIEKIVAEGFSKSALADKR